MVAQKGGKFVSDVALNQLLLIQWVKCKPHFLIYHGEYIAKEDKFKYIDGFMAYIVSWQQLE